jgi:hypothetical protein
VLMGHKRPGTTSIYTHLFADAFDGIEETLDAKLGVNQTSMNGRVTTEHRENGTDTESVEDRMDKRVFAA